MNSKKIFSRFGIATFAFLVLSNISAVIFALIFGMVSSGAAENSDISALITFVSVDLIGFAVFWLCVRNLPKYNISRKKAAPYELLIYMTVCFAVSVLGSFIGTAVSQVLSGGNARNYISDLMENPGLFTIFDVVVFGPVAEEIIFRKLVIDRTVQFGEKNAVIFSAVLFGMMHGNFYQLFYAFGIGLVLGYLYIRTGKIRYTVLLHIIFNFVCGALPSLISSELLFGTLDCIFALFGFAFLIVFRKKIYFRRTIFEIERGSIAKTVYFNLGMILFFAAALLEFVYAVVRL